MLFQTQPIFEISAQSRLRRAKNHMRTIKNDYQNELKQHHLTSLSLQKTQKQSLMKRNQFLKLYSTKKVKCESKQLQDQKKKEKQWNYRHSFEQTKNKRLQQEVQLLLLRNEEQQKIAKIQLLNKTQKIKIRQLKDNRKQQLMYLSQRNHDQVRQNEQQLQRRKKAMSASVNVRAKHSYYSRIRQEMQMISQYNSLMGQITDFVNDVGLQEDLKQFQKPLVSTGKKNNFFMTAQTIDA